MTGRRLPRVLLYSHVNTIAAPVIESKSIGSPVTSPMAM